MRRARWTVRRRLTDRFIPRLSPGAHRYCALLDSPSDSCIIDAAAFTAWAARMYPEGVSS